MGGELAVGVARIHKNHRLCRKYVLNANLFAQLLTPELMPMLF